MKWLDGSVLCDKCHWRRPSISLVGRSIIPVDMRDATAVAAAGAEQEPSRNVAAQQRRICRAEICIQLSSGWRRCAAAYGFSFSRESAASATSPPYFTPANYSTTLHLHLLSLPLPIPTAQWILYDASSTSASFSAQRMRIPRSQYSWCSGISRN